MVVGRFIGWLLLVAAAVMLAGDVLQAWRTAAWAPTPLGAVIYRLDPGALNLTQAVIQRYIHPALWDDVLLPMLQWPGWADLGGLGIILLVLFRRRAPKRRRWFASR